MASRASQPASAASSAARSCPCQAPHPGKGRVRRIVDGHEGADRGGLGLGQGRRAGRLGLADQPRGDLRRAASAHRRDAGQGPDLFQQGRGLSFRQAGQQSREGAATLGRRLAHPSRVPPSAGAAVRPPASAGPRGFPAARSMSTKAPNSATSPSRRDRSLPAARRGRAPGEAGDLGVGRLGRPAGREDLQTRSGRTPPAGQRPPKPGTPVPS